MSKSEEITSDDKGQLQILSEDLEQARHSDEPIHMETTEDTRHNRGHHKRYLCLARIRRHRGQKVLG